MLDEHELRYKEYLKLRKRLDFLQDELKKVPLTKLDKPYQKGWIIYFDLRSDIKNRADAPALLASLGLQYGEGYTSNVKVVKDIRKGKYHGITDFAHTHYYFPRREYISEGTYLFFDASIKKHFILDEYNDRYRKYGYKAYKLSVPSYYLILKIKPNIITHTRIKGGPIQSEYDKLSKLVWGPKYYKYLKGYSKYYPREKERREVRDQLRKFKKGDIEEVNLETYKHSWW